ncbi:MAG: sodium:alanine symporter family protein [Eubacteriales bacterium]|jgi:AGCS family alanine or glycine:cation symporter|nr:sodium:alanine symporter family protein [Eubacteriales bacterium]
MLELVKELNGIMWGYILIILLCGTGIIYTFKLKFIQIRKFGAGWKLMFQHFSLKGEKKENGEMTPFQAIATAIAGQVGTGNLAGAATALISGGPGAIFWMWVSAFFGMSTIYAEATLAQEYKEKDKDGNVTGGPVYYIRQAFKGTLGKVMAALFAIFIVLALGFMGIMVQSNSISVAFSEAFKVRGIEFPTYILGIILAAIAFFIFVGGTKRLSAVVEKLVPFMAVIYIIGSVILLIMNASQIPHAFKIIFVGAFSPEAVLGGAAGITIQQAIRYGVARGLFSNEAGMGSTPHAHARATAKNPHEQGLIAMVSVFIDTFIILTLTAISVLCTGAIDSGKTGPALAQQAFVNTFGSSGDIFIAVCLLFFAFSTILSWHFFGAINIEYLLGKKSVKIYSIIVVLFVILGSMLKVELVWELADFFNGLMVIPNVLALLALSGIVVKISKNKDKL